MTDELDYKDMRVFNLINCIFILFYFILFYFILFSDFK